MKDKKGSQGILSGLSLNARKASTEPIENDDSLDIDDTKLIKRSYNLKPSTIKKLQQLKVFVYPDPNVTYNEIVDEAINLLFKNKKV